MSQHLRARSRAYFSGNARLRVVIAAAVSMLLAITLLPAGAAFADEEPTAQLQIRKTVLTPVSAVLAPGDRVTYKIDFNCSDANGEGCVNAVMTDPVPDPLVITPGTLSVSGVGTNWVNESSGNTVQIAINQPLGASGAIGLVDGRAVSVTFEAQLPVGTSADWDGDVANNIASFAADNGIVNPVTWSAPVTLTVDPTLLASIVKTADPTSTPNVPGNDVTFTLTAGNASNRSVDELVVSDFADSPQPDPFDQLALDSISSLTPPSGADLVAFDWRDDLGDWHTGSPVEIPTVANSLLAGIPVATVTGYVFRFTSSTAPHLVPPTPAGEQGVIVVRTVVRDGLDNTAPMSILNVATAAVFVDADKSPDAVDDAGVTITPSGLGPYLEKSFSPTALNSGQTTTVRVHSQNGDFPIVEMSITEPNPGDLDLVQQGLDFQAWVDAQVAWPVGATALSIQYTYADLFAESPKTLTAIDIDTIPAPTSGHPVTGFHAVFTGTMEAGEYATLPFTAVAEAVTEDTTLRNIVTSTVHTADNKTSDAVAFADLTRRALRINTTIDKIITPSTTFGVSGAVVRVKLHATVKSGDGPVIPGPPVDPNYGSTIGAESLVISDPVVGPTGGAIDPFWDSLDLTGIPLVAVPNNAILTVQYWDGSTWTDLPGAESVAGPATWSTSIPGGLRSTIQGIRFEFVANSADADGLLQPGFVVQPYLDFAVRTTLRSDPAQQVIDNDGTTNVDLLNTARSTVENDTAAEPVVSRNDDAQLTLRPLNGGGPGPDVDLLQKGWLTDDGSVDYIGDSQVIARTSDSVVSHLGWSTSDLPFDSVTVSEPADPAPLTDSYLDAFDIVGVNAITPALDPQLTFDAVVGVYRYSISAGDWVDVTAVVCGPTGTLCDGTFPGYQVHVADRDDTTGVRLVFAESPTRASRISGPDDPAVGSGVASSSAARGIEIAFELRDTLRSNPLQAVLGSIEYNLVGEKGYVNNTASATGEMADGQTVSDSDDAKTWIIDVPKNVSVDKSWDQDVVSIPQTGTPQDEFPIATVTVTGTNETAAKVDQLVVDDPASDSPVSVPVNSGTFDVFNLYQIRSLSVPVGATSTIVTLTRESGVDPHEYSVAEVLALQPTDLSDVVGFSVNHTGRIEAGAATEIVLDMQLRQQNRSSGADVQTDDTAVNTAKATVIDPGGTVDDENQAWDDDSITTAQPSYRVTATKSITPNERYTNDADHSVAVRLSGQPDRDPTIVGSAAVRTKSLVITDATPTFFNAYTFTAFEPIVLPAPVQQVTVETLVGVDYALVGGELVSECAGDPDVSACWVGTGVALVPAANSSTITASQLLANLAPGVDPADVQGLRFTFARLDGTNWERPYNPTLVVNFAAERREFLVYSTGGATDTPVPSTRPTQAPAPGESARGTTTNVVDVFATGSWQDPGGSVWVADDTATAKTVLRHQINSVKVEKSPKDSVLPGQDIPFELTVTNTGAWPMTGLALIDTIQGDGDGPLLSPAVREIGDTTPVYTFGLKNGSGTSVAAPVITPVVASDGLTIDFQVESGFVLQPGFVLTITAAMRYRDNLQAGATADNSYTVSNDRVLDVCEYTDRMVLQPEVTVVDDCTATTRVYSLPASPIQVVKGVKGDGAGVLGALSTDPNYDDLGVLAYSGAPNTAYCSTPNALEGYYRHPCVPITRPGGEEVWKVWFKNGGNIPVQVLSGIDVLPANNDRGVIINQARSSRWAPTFLGDVSFVGLPAGADAQLLYLTTAPTTVCNRLDILNDTKPGGIDASDINPGGQFPGETTACLSDVATRAWTTYDAGMSAAAKAGIAALKVIVTYADGEGLAPQQTTSLQYRTATAAYPLRAETTDRDSIAWNSVAVGSRGVYVDGATMTYQVGLVAEARKTGIAMATGKVEFSKSITTPGGWSAALLNQYTFAVACTSLGQPVPLRDATGAAITSLTLKSDGSVVEYNNGKNSGQPGFTNWSQVNVPLYATCSLTEVATQGAVVTYVPTNAVALRDFATRSDVWNKAWPTAVDLNGVVADNEYSFGGFTVSKSTTAGGATTAAGGAIVYNGPFSFTASCMFLGNEVLGAGDRAFTVVPGTPRVVSQVPAGSVCTVTELTTTGGATRATTTMTVTTATGTAAAVTAKTVNFTVTADESDGTHTNSIAVANAFQAGKATITKQFSGSGAGTWDTTNFTVRLVCTLASATPSTVFDSTQVLTKASPTWEVLNLATGASCTTTETAIGGANGSAVSPGTFTVRAASAAATPVTVTNTFSTGTLRVTKALAGTPASTLAPATGDSYEVSAVCERVVNGSAQPVTIPGGATRTISAPLWYAEYTGLPTAATCVVSETDAGFATSTTLLPSTGGATIAAASTVTVAVTNTFANGALAITKDVIGDGSEFAPTSFGALVTCTWHGASVPLANGGRVVLLDGQTTTVSGIPVGSSCAVAEDDEGQSAATITPASTTVTANLATPATIAVTNSYALASLRVEKQVQSNANPLPTKFGFSVLCTYLDVTVLDETFLLDDNEHRDFTALPARAECVIQETDARGANSTTTAVTVEDPTVAPTLDQATRTVTIPELSPDSGVAPANTASYTNLFGVGGMTVTKVLKGGGSDQFGSEKVFTVGITCTFENQTLVDVTRDLEASNGFTASLTGLVAGTSCVIAEPDLQGADAVVIAPDDGVITIPEDDVAQVTVTNWYLTGSLDVTKLFSGDGADKFGTADFELQLECTRDGKAVTIADDGVRTVTADEPLATYAQLPTGSSCVLTETNTGSANATRIVAADGTTTLATDATVGYTFIVETSTDDLSVDDQPQPALGVENTFNFARVSTTKTVDSTALDAEGTLVEQGPFTFALECYFDGNLVHALEDDSLTIADGETAEWTELPEGADCSLTETDDKGAASTTLTVTQDGVTDDLVDGINVVLAPLVAVGELDFENTVAAVNRFEAAELTVRKVVDGTNAASITRTFPVTVECTLIDESHPEPGLLVRDSETEIGGPDDLTVDETDLPAGAECIVTETDAGGANHTTVRVDDELPTLASTVTLELEPGINSAVDVLFTNTFDKPLVNTGLDIRGVLGGSLVLLLGGVGALFIARRRAARRGLKLMLRP